MITLRQENSNKNYDYKEYVVDTAAEVSEIDKDTCAVGSVLYIIETGETQMLNNTGEWTKIKVGGSSSSSGAYIETIEIDGVFSCYKGEVIE